MIKDPFSNVKAVMTDIEGTITSPSFKEDNLLPYIRSNIAEYVWDFEPDITECINAVRGEENNQDLNTEEIIEVLLRYISEGENNPSLQKLSVQVLQQGYDSQKIQAFVYEDVVRAFRRWREQGILVYVYSTFSIEEQRLFFAHTQTGDISASFDKMFDVQQSGDKKQTDSYNKIAAAIGTPAADILFLTDNIEHAVTASNTGMKVIVLDRQACLVNAYGRRIEHDFDNILPETVPA